MLIPMIWSYLTYKYCKKITCYYTDKYSHATSINNFNKMVLAR